VDQRLSCRFACIVGAPRTGTTSLAQFMRAHPSICFSKLKEPHFFSQHDLNGIPDEELRQIVTAEYLDRFFPHRREDGSLLAEASVTYLYTPQRMRPILRLWPEAKFIICLRDPVEMIPSLHQRLLVLGDENVRDFERAWRLVDARRRGRSVPRSCIEPRWLRYDELGRLGFYVGRFISVVGRNRCFFVLHDDLRSDAARAYRDVIEFLGLPPCEPADTTPRRVRRDFKYGWLQRLLMRPPVITRRLLAGSAYRRRVDSLSKLDKRKSPGIRIIERSRKNLLKWNETEAPQVALSPALRAEFGQLYREDIKRLEDIIGRNLDHWLGPAPD